MTPVKGHQSLKLDSIAICINNHWNATHRWDLDDDFTSHQRHFICRAICSNFHDYYQCACKQSFTNWNVWNHDSWKKIWETTRRYECKDVIERLFAWCPKSQHERKSLHTKQWDPKKLIWRTIWSSNLNWEIEKHWDVESELAFREIWVCCENHIFRHVLGLN